MRILPTVGFPDKLSVHWEYHNPKEPLEMLPLIPRMDKPHIVLNGQIKKECNYGPDRNLLQKTEMGSQERKRKGRRPQPNIIGFKTNHSMWS